MKTTVKKKVAPPGFHYMDNGKLMANSKMKKSAAKPKTKPRGY